jgi:hypothetical protein
LAIFHPDAPSEPRGCVMLSLGVYAASDKLPSTLRAGGDGEEISITGDVIWSFQSLEMLFAVFELQFSRLRSQIETGLRLRSGRKNRKKKIRKKKNTKQNTPDDEHSGEAEGMDNRSLKRRIVKNPDVDSNSNTFQLHFRIHMAENLGMVF